MSAMTSATSAARAADDEIDGESLDGPRATRWEVGASRDDVLEVERCR